MKKEAILLISVLLILPITLAVDCADVPYPGADGYLNESYTLTENITASSRGQVNRCLKVTADDVTLDCNGYTIDSKNIKRSSFSSIGYDRITVKNCNFINSISNAFGINAAEDAQILDNTFADDDAGWSGDGALISGNTFRDRFGIDGDNAVIENNEFIVNLGIGQVALNIGGYSTNNLIRFNTFRQPEQIGAGLKQGHAIYTTTSAHFNNITNNTIEGFNTGINFWTFAGYTEIYHNYFANNSVNDSNFAVHGNYGDLNEVADNTFAANTVGVYFEGSVDNVLWGNNFQFPDVVNYWDTDNNHYCSGGIENDYEFMDNLLNMTLEEFHSFVIQKEADLSLLHLELPFTYELLNETNNYSVNITLPDCNQTKDNQSNQSLAMSGDFLKELSDPVLFDLVELQNGFLMALDPWDGFKYFYNENAWNGDVMVHQPNGQTDYWVWEVHSTPNTYRVWVYIPVDPIYVGSYAKQAMYYIKHANGMDKVILDQRLAGSDWVNLGDYTFDESSYQGVALIGGNGRGHTLADAFRAESIGPPQYD